MNGAESLFYLQAIPTAFIVLVGDACELSIKALVFLLFTNINFERA